MRVALGAPVLWAAAMLGGVVGCTTLPGSGDPHPGSGRPADAFSMAQPRCAAQRRQPALAHKGQLRDVRIGGQPVYLGTAIICE